MSGHSKWSTIKHKKGALDAKRGNIFTKLSKNLTIAAKEGGKDLSTNIKLKLLIAKAKQANMPKDNIERAIKKGTGELEGVTYEECVYEGFGPAGSALVIECITDNTNRAVQEIKTILNKNGGNMGGPNSVMWMFTQCGYISFPISDLDISGEEAEMFFIELGVNDYKINENKYELFVTKEDLHTIVVKLNEKTNSDVEAKLIFKANDLVSLNEEEQEKLFNLVEKLDNHDDVNDIYVNVA